ncbi:MAG: Fe-S cluster assembly protein SufB, partial [Bacteroidetes bacterium]|nr:Fe-S cluster assembly protein SufB [Bacteroidota bacterium]
MSTSETEYLQGVADQEYEHGWYTDIETETAPKGLNEDVIRMISSKKEEPEWLLEWRLKAFRYFNRLIESGHYPDWAHLDYERPDFQDISYFSAPKDKANYDSLDEVPDEILETFERLGIPLDEQKALTGVAVDAVMDSVSVATTFKEKLKEKGVIFMSFGEAAREHPEIVKQHLGTVVPYTDNLYAALNSAVFSDGSFVYVPEGVRCPMELSTYFRINEQGTGQFERTLIVAEPGSYVSYLEGCTAPMRKENQLHAAVVELIAKESAEIKYSTIQNWYPGNPETGEGGVYNLVTKRGICKGDNAKISWTQLETGSAVTQKYPSVILKGDNSIGEFYSVAFTKGKQQADTGTKMH